MRLSMRSLTPFLSILTPLRSMAESRPQAYPAIPTPTTTAYVMLSSIFTATFSQQLWIFGPKRVAHLSTYTRLGYIERIHHEVGEFDKAEKSGFG